MSWQQLHLHLSATDVERFENYLLQHGALSITLQDAADEPIFEPELGSAPVWSNSILTALFNLHTDVRKVAGQLQDLVPGHNLNVKIEMLDDQDWERTWLQYFKPMQFAEHFWVIPSGYEIPNPKAINLLLDPGLAFGTGTHPTTAMCLTWLAKHDVQNKTVIDYGCGSGILAVAALLLGAKQVWAIDYDPQALTATTENAKRNEVDLKKLHTGKNAELPNDFIADVMLANILANPLITLAPTLASHVKPQGTIVLSGILATQTDNVIDAYTPFFAMEPALQQDDWIRLVGRK